MPFPPVGLLFFYAESLLAEMNHKMYASLSCKYLACKIVRMGITNWIWKYLSRIPIYESQKKTFFMVILVGFFPSSWQKFSCSVRTQWKLEIYIASALPWNVSKPGFIKSIITFYLFLPFIYRDWIHVLSYLSWFYWRDLGWKECCCDLDASNSCNLSVFHNRQSV